MGEVFNPNTNVGGPFGMFVQYSKHPNHNSTVQDVCIKQLVEQTYWQGLNLFDQKVFLSVADRC